MTNAAPSECVDTLVGIKKDSHAAQRAREREQEAETVRMAAKWAADLAAMAPHLINIGPSTNEDHWAGLMRAVARANEGLTRAANKRRNWRWCADDRSSAMRETFGPDWSGFEHANWRDHLYACWCRVVERPLAGAEPPSWMADLYAGALARVDVLIVECQL